MVPHIFMHRDILPKVVFAPANLALDICDGLVATSEVEITLFSPGPINTSARNISADLSLFEEELARRGDSYIDLLKKHPITFISLARQVQGELIAKAFSMANNDELDVVHIYTNEEDIALPFISLCNKPVVLTHHDPFNLLVKYKNTFPKYNRLNWLSISLSQRLSMPDNTNWVGNIYHGIRTDRFQPNYNPTADYFAYLGRIIEHKGLHLAIAAIKHYNATHEKKHKLIFAGKHYAGYKKDSYWKEKIEPHLADPDVEYVGFLDSDSKRQEFLGNARALIMPSTYEEPFGMVMIEALACASPVIGLNVGAIPEVITHGTNGLVIEYKPQDVSHTVRGLAAALDQSSYISRKVCRSVFEQRFTAGRMCAEHLLIYKNLKDN